jgi:hypothetical protein
LAWRTQKQLKKDLKRTEKQLQEVTQDRDQLQERLLALNRVDVHVWKKPDLYSNNRFVPREQRPTRFIALVNLKGGVGKTTLALNLGISLGLRDKRVLLADLDFQGTLSNMALPRELVNDYRDKGWTTDALLNANGGVRVQNLLFDVPDATWNLWSLSDNHASSSIPSRRRASLYKRLSMCRKFSSDSITCSSTVPRA